MGKLKDWLSGFFRGAFSDTLFADLEREAKEVEEIVLVLALLQFSGLENPFSFYALELLPFMEITPYSLRRLISKEERLGYLFSRFEGWA